MTDALGHSRNLSEHFRRKIAGADSFEGTLELGYQIGFPWSLGVGINFSYTTPNILLDDTNINPLSAGFNPLGSVITPNLFPGVSISADLGNGPGIQEVATFSVDVSGPHGKVAVKPAAEAVKSHRVEKTRVSQPESGITMISAIR